MGAQREKQQISFGNEAWPVGGEGDTSQLSISGGCPFTKKNELKTLVATWSCEEKHRTQIIADRCHWEVREERQTDLGHSTERQAKDAAYS